MRKNFRPRELPFIGSAHVFGKDQLTFLNKLHRDFGPHAEFNVPGTHFIAIFDPKLVEHVMVKNHANYKKNVFLMERWKDFLGRGILSSYGDEWKRSRRVLQPSMSKDKLENYFGTFVAEAIKYGDSLTDGKIVNMKEDMMNSLFHALVRILFHSAEMDDQTIRRFDGLFARCMDYFDYTLSPAGMLLHKFPTREKRNYLAAINELNLMMKEMLAKETSPHGSDLLTLLKNARDDEGQAFSEKSIRDNLLSLFVAGHETASLAITYSLFLLAQNPEEMKKARSEIEDVLRGKKLEFDDIEQLKTIRNVVYESMRLLPPVGMMGREALGNDHLGELPVKKGDSIIIPIFSIHRSPQLYEDPEKFRPDRWNEKDLQTMRNEFIPFGAGPRVCTGANLAMMEITTFLAIILQKHSFELVSNSKLELFSSVSMRPKRPILLKAKSE